MMTGSAEHYDKHLGPVYRWMVGDVAGAVEANKRLLAGLGLRSTDLGLAVDLGAGIGLQTLALERLGYFVLAVDECRALVEGLRRETDGMQVRVAEDDILNFRRYMDEEARLVVCMGDTLTHLESKGAVMSVLEDVVTAMEPGGAFVTTFRDYSTEPVGTRRTILVRGDDQRILTCRLEYLEKTVLVTDLLHERPEGGAWTLKASSYEKVRVEPAWVEEELVKLGMTVERGPEVSGMVCVVGRKRR